MASLVNKVYVVQQDQEVKLDHQGKVAQMELQAYQDNQGTVANLDPEERGANLVSQGQLDQLDHREREDPMGREVLLENKVVLDHLDDWVNKDLEVSIAQQHYRI